MIKINVSHEMNHHDASRYKIVHNKIKMVDHRNPNHRFPLPILWVKGTTLPLEEVGCRGGTRDELEVEAPNSLDVLAEVEGDGDKVEGKVSFLLPIPVDPSPTIGMNLHGGGGSIGYTRRSISSSSFVSTGSGTSSSSSPPPPPSLPPPPPNHLHVPPPPTTRVPPPSYAPQSPPSTD
jgi:hypothetical protein